MAIQHMYGLRDRDMNGTLVSRWMAKKETKCNFSLFNYTIFGAPAHKSQFIQLLFMKTKFWPAIAIVPFHLKFRLLGCDFNSICTTIRVLLPFRVDRESENDFWFRCAARIAIWAHNGMTQQQKAARVKCDKHAMWFERTTLPTCCCLFRAAFMWGT